MSWALVNRGWGGWCHPCCCWWVLGHCLWVMRLVCGQWSSYTRGGGSRGHLCVGWSLFHHGVVMVCFHVVMVCNGVVVMLHHSFHCHITLLVTWPLHLGVRRGWRTIVSCTYLKELDSDNMAHLPCCLCYPHASTHSMTWH